MTIPDPRPFRIMSIDGGGIRGVFPAHIIKCIQEKQNVDVFNYFDMFAGTSTGSIIAAGIACQIDPASIVTLYQQHGRRIFGSRIHSLWPSKVKVGIHSTYDSTPLSEILVETFGDIRLGDIKKPLIIPATDVGNGGVHVFKSDYPNAYTRDGNVPIHEAVLASCSAPVYFDPALVDNYLLADGGLWANSPGLTALIDAERHLSIPRERVRLLSLGTGVSKTAYGVDTKRSWGLVTGWQDLQFVSFVMSLQTQATHNYLKLMLDDHFFSLNFTSDKPLPLDNVDSIADLVSRADALFTYQGHEIAAFLDLKEE